MKIVKDTKLEDKEGVKNIRLRVPLEIYQRLKKLQAKRILDNLPEMNLADVCVSLLDSATESLKEKK